MYAEISAQNGLVAKKAKKKVLIDILGNEIEKCFVSFPANSSPATRSSRRPPTTAVMAATAATTLTTAKLWTHSSAEKAQPAKT